MTMPQIAVQQPCVAGWWGGSVAWCRVVKAGTLTKCMTLLHRTTPPQAVQHPYMRTARTPDSAQQPPHPSAASPFALPPSRQASGASPLGPGPHRVTSQRELPSSPVSSTGSEGGLLQAASRHASVTVKQPGLLPGQEGAPGWRRGAVGELVRQQQRSPGMEQQRTGSFFPTGDLSGTGQAERHQPIDDVGCKPDGRHADLSSQDACWADEELQ